MRFVAHIFQADPALIRLALWIASGGRVHLPDAADRRSWPPGRFLNMLRVFKLRSPMSMGAWILVAFSGCAFVAVAGNELVLLGYGFPLVRGVRWLGEASGALTGLLLASYTGVLIGATAIPVWFTHRRFLPAHFLTSGLGGASAILELCGFFIPATQTSRIFYGRIGDDLRNLFRDSQAGHGRSASPRRIRHRLSHRGPPGRANRAGRPHLLGIVCKRPVCGGDLFSGGLGDKPLRMDLGGSRFRQASGCAVRAATKRRGQTLKNQP